MFILEARWGNDGYAGIYKVMEILGDEPGQYYDARKPDKWEFLVAKIGVSAPEILQKLSDLEVIDPELWFHRIIWMQSFVDSLKELYRKRNTPPPSRPPLSQFLPPETGENPGFRAGNPEDEHDRDVPGAENPQSKVKESKEKKNISSDTEAVRLADLLFSSILKNQPESKLHALNNGGKEKTTGTWSLDIEKLMRIDKRPVERIEKVIAWATADSFWKGNILSGLKLREKWDTLVAQMSRGEAADAYDW